MSSAFGFVCLLAVTGLTTGFQVAPKLIGGTEVVPNSVPYQAALVLTSSKGLTHCSGTVISQNYVLTAAHCVDGITQVEVILGAHNFQVEEESQVHLYTADYVKHVGWSPLQPAFDIAVIKLPKPVQFNENVTAIALPKYSDFDVTFAGVQATVTGWGKTSNSGELSSVLRSLVVDVMLNSVCEIEYLGTVHDSNLCSNGINNVGGCDGDSGAPLVYEGKLIGLTSHGSIFGCETGWPTVYTRTTSVLDWIAGNTDVIIEP